ncbi:MAG: dihydropteroate synthase [Candidatus Omnitrophica bacterium]|nr:dihydropteroate synthase [Candidatus Omnitrophota bacterium]
MGILNVTPDSFSSDGLLTKLGTNPRAHLRYGLNLIKQGADILDIGGESTRPGAKPISAKEEIKRVVPVIRLLAQKTNTPISVDTCKPRVAKLALEAGASIVNIIMGTVVTKTMLNIIKDYDAAVILMHMRRTPRTMQKRIHYKNLMKEIIAELKSSVEKCLETGIKSDRIIIDPGIGFCKTTKHNLEIIKRLKQLSILKTPILIGTSRKSFIGSIVNKEPSKRQWGTAATVCASILNGAHIVRVHDVAPMRDVADVTDAIIHLTI